LERVVVGVPAARCERERAAGVAAPGPVQDARERPDFLRVAGQFVAARAQRARGQCLQEHRPTVQPEQVDQEAAEHRAVVLAEPVLAGGGGDARWVRATSSPWRCWSWTAPGAQAMDSACGRRTRREVSQRRRVTSHASKTKTRSTIASGPTVAKLSQNTSS